MKRWVTARGEVESPEEVEEFIAAIQSVCRTHGFSISHEDGHGAFLIDAMDEGNLEWLAGANLTREALGLA